MNPPGIQQLLTGWLLHHWAGVTKSVFNTSSFPVVPEGYILPTWAGWPQELGKRALIFLAGGVIQHVILPTWAGWPQELGKRALIFLAGVSFRRSLSSEKQESSRMPPTRNQSFEKENCKGSLIGKGTRSMQKANHSRYSVTTWNDPMVITHQSTSRFRNYGVHPESEPPLETRPRVCAVRGV